MTTAVAKDGAITHGLFHLAIKTSDLAATVAFFTGVIGLREVPRPDFGYPGAWLACPQPGGQAIVHVYAGGPAQGPGGHVAQGTAAIDHVTLSSTGFHAYRARFSRAGLAWREFLVPAIGFNKVQGRPFKVSEIADRARKLLRDERLEDSAA